MNRHEYFVYDGRDCIGRFTLNDDTGEAKAFDGNKSLGTFPSFKAAADAVSKAHRAAIVPIVKRGADRARSPAARPAAHA